ncbi:MAG: FxLYD domain-containing protein [Candidatus Hydrothermarchaeales archaeon]
MKTIYSMMLGMFIFFLLLYGLFQFSGYYMEDSSELFSRIIITTPSQPPIATPTITPESAVVKIIRWERYLSDSGAYINVEGEVENIGDTDAFYVKITAKYYDSLGNLVGVDGNFADEAMLAPNTTSRFEIKSPNKPEIDDVELNVVWK